MATTLDFYAPFDTGAGADVTESTWRDFMRHMLTDGVLWDVLNNFEVFADSTGMQVKVKSGECWIRGHWGRQSTQKTFAIASSSGSNPRKDLVVLRADFVNNRIECDVRTGTAAASPVVPTLSQTTSVWEIAIATITVGTSVSTISAASVDRSVCPFTGGIPSGSILMEAEYQSASNQALATGADRVIAFDTQSVTSALVTRQTDSTGHRFVLNRPGLWLVNTTIRWGNTGAGERYNAINRNGSPTASANGVASSIPVTNNLSICRRFNIGDYVTIIGYQNTGASHSLESNGTSGWGRVNLAWIHG